MAGSELDLVGGAINASTVSEALMPQLEEVLLKAADATEAARKIARDPKLLAAARDQLSTVSRLAQPLTENELYIALQPLVIMYGAPDFGQDAEAAHLQRAWFDIYKTTLKEHPKEAIEIAVAEVLRTHRYNKFPLPADLHKFAQETTAEIKMIEFRLRKAVQRADEHRPPPKKNPEDKEAVKAMIDDMRGADGHIHLTKASHTATPATDRRATAEALRRLAQYR